MRPPYSRLLPVAAAAVSTAWLILGASVALAGGPFAPRHQPVTSSGPPSTLAQAVSIVVVVAICAGLGLLAWRAERRRPAARVTALPTISQPEKTHKAA